MADDELSKLRIDKAPTVSKKRSRRWYYLAVVIVLVVVAAIAFSSGLLSPAVEVETAMVTQVYPSQTVTVLNASGYVVAQRKAAIASKVTGKIISLYVEEGSRVKKGQVVARLEAEDVSAAQRQAGANLEAARSNLDQARAELLDATAGFDREKWLLPRDSTAKASYDSAEARYKKAVAGVTGGEWAVKAATATLEATGVAVEYTYIRTPFDAVVLTKNADVGDIVTPLGAAANAKAAVVTIADMSSLQVEADISESSLGRVKMGQPCELQLDALPGKRFPGSVHMIVPTADRSKATIMAKIRFLTKDERILPEMSAKVSFLSRALQPSEQQPKTGVFKAAILQKQDKSLIFLIRKGRAVETPVKTGAALGDYIEILGGAQAGDRVVLRPLEKIHNGSRIKVPEQ